MKGFDFVRLVSGVMMVAVSMVNAAPNTFTTVEQSAALFEPKEQGQPGFASLNLWASFASVPVALVPTEKQNAASDGDADAPHKRHDVLGEEK